MLAEGAFVKVLFPTAEQPRRPGLLHIGYCLAVAPPLALVAYTSSRSWPADVPLPLGVRVFGRDEAARLNQRPFVLYLKRIAKLPMTARWFPEMHEPSAGIVAVAPLPLRDELLDIVRELLRRRREAIRRFGS
ncbi:MAG TPA: hypothetical protein VFA50_09995 [Stellaceae bacterium]|nr:hypothetical protein [Stellaceae bacterium]